MQKTRKTVAKRFKLTKKGKVVAQKGNRNHMRSVKSKKQLSSYKSSKRQGISTHIHDAIIDNIA